MDKEKDMVKYLFDLYFRFDPDFQPIMEVEYPKLTGEQQLRFLGMLNDDMGKLVERLRKLQPEPMPLAA